MSGTNNRANGSRKSRLVAVGQMASAVAICLLIIASVTGPQIQAQSSGAATTVFRYDVISVKRSQPGANGGSSMNTPDGFVMTNSVLVGLIYYAYGLLNPEQLAQAPSWVSSELYTIEAKMDPSVAASFQKLSRDERIAVRREMLQALLAERFNLKVHHATRDLPIYSLEIAKNGPRLKEAKANDPNVVKGPDGSPLTDSMELRNGESGETWIGHAVSTSYLVRNLEPVVGRIVLDKTGLTGHYDFSMQFVRDQIALQAGGDSSAASNPGALSLYTAIEKDLGLKLEAGKAPIDVVVIDHMERPSGN